MILDLFAGPGGWSEGLRHLGLSDIGIELDRTACATRAAAGHETINADITELDPRPWASNVELLIASPPCQAWSHAGKRQQLADPRAHLVYEVPRWVRAIRPLHVACEQVPPVLAMWERFAAELSAIGYRTWTGCLQAEQYGVPQTRKRAFLLASLTHEPTPPAPTHRKYRKGVAQQDGDPALLPWVSMAEGLGWGPEPPSSPLAWAYERPATTVTTRNALGWPGHHTPERRQFDVSLGAYLLDPAEAAALQSFDPSYPWQGGRTKHFQQIGNAVPPALAGAVCGQLLAELDAAAA